MSDDYDELCIPQENAQECTEKEDTGPNLFDIINAISNQQAAFYEEIDGLGIPKGYNQFMINKAFGNFQDTILIANELNKMNIPDEAHLAFLKGTVHKRKRFTKWFKPDIDTFIEILAKLLNITQRSARYYIPLLKQETIDEIIEITAADGTSKKERASKKRSRK